jgi:hypothetical protein
MLRSTKLPIKVIAGTTGFNSRSHFSKAFRDAYGADPTSFRSDYGVRTLDAPAPLHGERADFGLAKSLNDVNRCANIHWVFGRLQKAFEFPAMKTWSHRRKHGHPPPNLEPAQM